MERFRPYERLNVEAEPGLVLFEDGISVEEGPRYDEPGVPAEMEGIT